MREALGSYYALLIVFGFIIIISAFLAFTTNYNKAFKMKNRIITILEKNNNEVTDRAQREIRDYAKSIGYSASKKYTNNDCDGVDFALDKYNVGWCYRVKELGSKKTIASGKKGVTEYKSNYIDVKTFVSIDVPIFNNIFPYLNFFQVTGATRQITKLNK